MAANTSTPEQMDLTAVDDAEPIKRDAKPDATAKPQSLAEVMANLGRDELNKLLAMTGRTEVKYDQDKGDFIIESFEGLQRVATLYVRAGMCRRLVERGENLSQGELIDRATAVMQAGGQLGLSTFASIRYMAWIRGNPSPWGDAIPSIVYRAKNPDGTPCVMEFDETIDQYESKSGKRWRAKCRIVRKLPSGGLRTVEHTFSYDDAVNADLHGSPTWKAWEKRMVQCRARSWAARDAVPDAMCGMVAAEEEMDTAYLESRREAEKRKSNVAAKIDSLPEQ